MNKIYTSPFDWGYIDDNTLIYEGSTSEEIKKMVDEALDEALDDVLDDVVDEAVDKMDIKLEGSDLLYKLMVNGTENGEINIPKDQFLQSASYDSENKQLVFVIGANGDQGTEVRVAVEDLVSAIEAKNAEQDTKNDQQDEAIENVQAALADKADTTYVDEKVAAVEVPDVSGLATKEEVAAVDTKVDSLVIPSVEGLATEAYVDEKVAAVEIPDVSGLATKEEVNAVDAKVEAIDLTPYATAQALADEVERATTKESGIEEALNQEAQRATNAESELSGKDTQLQANIDAVDAKVDSLVIPSVEGLATETYVDEKVASVEIPDVSGFATKEEVAAVDTKVDAKADTTYVDEKNGLQDDAISAINDLVEGLSDTKVDWVASTPERKHIVLENHDSILGTATTGDTYNLAMVSKWDVADFGSTSLHLNLNTKDGVATINDNKNIATEDFVNSAVAAIDLSNYATKTEVETAAAGAVAQIVANAPEDLDTLKEVADYIASDKTKASEIETTLAAKADKTEVESALDLKADKTELDGLATETYVDEKVAAIDLTPYATEGKVTEVKNELQTNIDTIDLKIAALSSEVDGALDLKANKTELEGLATETYVDNKIADLVGEAPETLDTLKEIADALADNATMTMVSEAISTKANKTDVTNEINAAVSTKTDRQIEGANGKALMFNESDGGGAKFEHVDGTWSFAGVNDGGENGIAGQIYALKKNSSDKMEGARIDVTKNGMYYTVGDANASERLVEGNKIAVKSDIPDVSGFANSSDVYTKAESDEKFQEVGDYVPVEDYNALLQKVSSLENYINVFIKDREEKMDEIINNMDADNKEVVIETPMESIVVPETTVAYTITAPLADNSTVELTSPKYMTLYNTSEEPVSTSIGHTFVEGESTSATTVYLVGDFDTLTLENVSPAVKSGEEAASVNNVVISENNVKNLTLALDIQDGATITNNSNASITIQDKNDLATTLTIVAPNSTVTLNGSTYEEVNATVSDNTLFIKKNVSHIGTLNVSKGNVIVEVPRQSLITEKIGQYTLAEGYTIDYLHDEINSSNVANLAKEGTHTLVEDVAKTGNFSVGTFSTDDMIWELNGHNITSSNTRGYGIFRLRGSAHLEINDSVGTGIVKNTDDDYGLWTGTVDSKIVINGGNFEASTHVLYAEKGTIEVNGGTFKLTNWETADKDESGNLRFLINCHDADYVSGDAKIIVRGGKFYDFDPANCAAEGAGTSFVAEGYGSVMTTEIIDGVEHRVYEVKPINE